MYQNKKTGVIGIILMIIILVLVVILSNIDISEMSHIEKKFASLVMPIQNGLIYLKNKIKNNDQFFINVNKLEEENKLLKKKNSELEQELRKLEIIKSENETLKEYVNLKEKYKNYETIPAYIIQKDINNYNNTIIINVGEKDGIKPNMTVIADKGLVGYVISTSLNTSKVQTIIDTSSSVSSKITNSKEAIIVTGTLESKNKLKAKYIPTDTKIVVKEKVETSGIGGIYPKGIPIGYITEIVNTKNIINRYAYIETAVDFEKLETVLVIAK